MWEGVGKCVQVWQLCVGGGVCVCECARVCMGEHQWVKTGVYAGEWVSAGVYECVCGYARVCGGVYRMNFQNTYWTLDS